MTPIVSSLLSERPPAQADVAVIGAGITGTCASLFLAERGVRVCLIDRAMPWSEASGVNAGTLTVQGEFIETIPLTKLSVDLWQQFEVDRGLKIGFKRSGGLRVATNAVERAELMAGSEERRRRWSLPIEWLEGSALMSAAPWLGERVACASYCSEDGYCSPLTAAHALIEATVRAGATLVANAAVQSIQRLGNGYRIETQRGRIDATSVAITAGPWSSALTGMLGMPLPTYLDIDMLSVTEPAPPVMHGLVTHAGGLLSLKQFPNGSVVIGGGWQGKGRFAAMEGLDQTRLLQNLAFAASIVPGLAELRILRSWSGYEGVAPDGVPVIGPIPGAEHAYVAAITRGGYTHGPALALLLAELILDGKPRLPIRQFYPDRLSTGAARQATKETVQ